MPPRTQGGAAQRVGYPARATSARAMCRHASRCGVARLQMQHHAADRADDVDPQLQQPVAQPRHAGWRAHAVRAARNRSSCIST